MSDGPKEYPWTLEPGTERLLYLGESPVTLSITNSIGADNTEPMEVVVKASSGKQEVLGVAAGNTLFVRGWRVAIKLHASAEHPESGTFAYFGSS